ncbi:alpha-2,8-polysialyltransferase family protein [Tenacibaculum haliotis]|uniref:alpha-2,8-polysialyltransferase family protein n=1 Tax=Tenacibaculum haliotis TaxID=1888914 RepID=UPI0021AE49B0|nr:alpha-2,8-polysialyltransferase family protein [Tenacibaculum haliotis]MCT4698888.1 alpha-2,8-polysialyltransferase family protein [Tenacibaculum haliotis]
MKNVFWIHSNITFLLSNLIIKNLNIDSNKCVFILFRGYILPNNIYKIKEIRIEDNIMTNEFNYEEFYNKWLNILNFEYKLFIPQSKEKRILALISSGNCKEYNYIEEGLLAYNFSSSIFKIKFYSLLRCLKLRKKLQWLDFKHKKFKSCYTISDKAFLNSPSTIILPIKPDEIKCNYIIEKKSVIIILDGLVSFNKISLDESISLLKVIIEDVKKEDKNKIYFKWHPEHLRLKNIKEKKRILNIFNNEKELEFIEIPQAIILENVFFTHKNILVYVYLSSLGFYASMTGQVVKSLSSRIDLKLDKKITEKWIQI